MADTIYLDSFAMDKLICLCAHDFKHDFIEDSDRPKLALIGEGIGIPGGGNPKLQYHGTSSTTETVDEGETIEAAKDNLKMGNSSLVFPGTPLSEEVPLSKVTPLSGEEGYDENPEDFPLACYIYLNIADMCKNDEAKTLDTFNNFCDNLGKYNERIGLQKKRREAASLGADAAEARQKKRREAVVDGAEAQQSSKKRRKGGGKTGRHRGKGLILFKDKNKRMTALTSQSISKRLPSRTAQKRGLDQGNILKGKRERTLTHGPIIESKKDITIRKTKLTEWDKMLDIYKEWLSSPGRDDFYQDLNNVLSTQNFKPNRGDKRTFLIPSSEWESYEGSKEYDDWARLMSGRVKNAFNEIIQQCYQGGTNKNYPRMVSLKISTKKWDNIKQFSLYLLNEWEELVIANPADDKIYHKDKISSLKFKDEHMWKKSENYYNDELQPKPTLIKGTKECNNDERTRDNCSPFKSGEGDGQILDLTIKKKIINNSATLSKYINDPGNYYTCPIPSIIDPQSVCNSIPPMGEQGTKNERGDPVDMNYSVNVMEVGGRGRTISVQIINGGQHLQETYKKTSISFNGPGGQSINESRINDFALGGGPLSAYNVTLMFIQGFLKNRDGGLNEFGDWVNTEHTDPMSDPVTPFSQDKATLRSIAGIFALKLMGDFSQELYAISKNSTIDPLLFLANDRVSAARYLLLKVHGKREGGDNIIAEPGGGGFLSYGGKKNNYFLLMGPAPQPGGGKKKKKVKKTKTKTKSRKKVKKTKRKSRRKSRKSRKKT